MILALIRYYWQVLKYGNPLSIQEQNPIYGKEELSQNQHWYGFTALALVMGICLSASLIAFNLMNESEINNTISCCIGCHDILPPPPPPQPHQPDPKGELALGTTPVHLVHFYIPKPSPWKDIVEKGVRNDIKVRDPEGEDKIKDWTCELHLPDTLEPQIMPLDLSLVEFDLPEDREGEDFCFCSPYDHWDDMEQPEIIRDYSVKEAGFEKKVDRESIAVNLAEVKKLIGYPQILRDAGIVGGHEIRVMVSKEGTYESHTTEVELHPIMTDQIAKHIDKLIFTPAIRDGKPVAHYVKIPFRFCVIN